MLNGFFSAVTDVVFEHEGTVDKFIGDAVMAVFGAPLLQADHALRAVRTGLGIVKAVAKLNESRPGMPALRVRVGSTAGRCSPATSDRAKRLEYTVLGDVVNIASRMESSMAQPNQVVISRAVLDRLTGAGHHQTARRHAASRADRQRRGVRARAVAGLSSTTEDTGSVTSVVGI